MITVIVIIVVISIIFMVIVEIHIFYSMREGGPSRLSRPKRRFPGGSSLDKCSIYHRLLDTPAY